MAGTETELTIEMLDYLIDQIEGPTEALIMNKTMRRKIKHLMYAAGGGVQLATVEAFGKTMSAYDGIPIVITNYLKNDEQYGNAAGWSGSTATTIIAARFGEIAYVGAYLPSPLSITALCGIDSSV